MFIRTGVSLWNITTSNVQAEYLNDIPYGVLITLRIRDNVNFGTLKDIEYVQVKSLPIFRQDFPGYVFHRGGWLRICDAEGVRIKKNALMLTLLYSVEPLADFPKVIKVHSHDLELYKSVTLVD